MNFCIDKNCVVCDKKITVTVYQNRKYRGGHYFGKIKTEKNKMFEYWECPKCYYGDWYKKK
ncbi:MAG: hypothetical protein AUJ85_05755 [Elusimicrobia bacterium CG1_02_37_114]|nr:MAG: hypothetical protein AUJ85_05755 [Elusimicrobia bacterium CG1_02_37_114]PIV52923.1 MAG: hypothetical protein COS17_06485 [Elusimicrobia bacterium CG02_land_8_20_14_3_00_37_13]